jgi:hypothetical protein
MSVLLYVSTSHNHTQTLHPNSRMLSIEKPEHYGNFSPFLIFFTVFLPWWAEG